VVAWVGAPLIGRAGELGVLEDLLDGVEHEGRALVVLGDPGIGKSALVAEAARRAAARDMTVLRATGVQSEACLPFAGLHQLLRPLRARVERLPARQRDALRVALGRAGDEPPDDPYLVALATLDLLSDSAAEAPLLVVAEDAHWLDPSTAGVLAFVARRLASDPIVLLLSARPGWDGPLDGAGLAVLPLGGLDDDDAVELLAAHAPDLASPMRRRVLDLAGGNPLALIELPATSTALTEAALPPTWLPLTARLEQAFAARADALDATSRALLLVAALNDGDALAEILAAAGLVVGAAMTVDHVAPAAAAMLVGVDDGRLRFRHPLVRSAIPQAASASQRQAAHTALAQVLTGEPDRRLWHRTAATTTPDAELAGELDAAARRARRFGEASVAVAAYQRAAQLSESPALRGARLLDAAEGAFDMGRNDVVLRLLAEAELLDLGPLGRARLAWQRELLDGGSWSGAAKVTSSIGVIDLMRSGGHVDLALRSLLTLALRAWWATPDRESRELILGAADRMPVPPHDPLLLAVNAMAAPVDRASAVMGRVAQLGPDEVQDPETLQFLGLTLSILGAMDDSSRVLARSIEGLRSQGRLQLLAQTLVSRAWCDLVRGDWSAALAASGEAERLSRELARPSLTAAARAATAVLVAVRGDQDHATSIAAEVESFALPLGARPILAFAQLARACAALATARYGDGYVHLHHLFDPGDPAHHPFVTHLAVVDVAEAAAGCDRQADARALLAPLETQAARTPSPLLHSGLRGARALLAGDTDAEPLFEAALATEPGPSPFMRARLLLAHGTWLRRQRRAADSRPSLRAARNAFDALGADAWGDRARHELRASGEQSHPRPPAADDGLTAQELQVAQLAAQGLTNREIGERLYLSHRTVGAHLYHAFPKLGITTRSQLGDALNATSPR
jgi:DNA-binding CsgD family transcriptional regulator/tetratricopeptide (TPR) repeat protein